MFCKLALRNVRRSFRDYGVYLLTLTFGVCLFYAFSSLDGQGAMIYLAQSQNPMAQVIQSCIDVFSIFVAVGLACLILYADRFLMRRRKRELGTYLLLGLSQGQVSLLLVLETGLIGAASLALGLLLGLAASQGLSALTLSMFSLRMDAFFRLAFSPRAAARTVLYFGMIFLLVMGFSGIQISRAKLLDLMQGGRKNEELRPRPLRTSVIQLVLGGVCLAAAYAILLTFGMAFAVVLPFLCIPMLTLGTVGTLLVFRSLSGFVLRLARSHPGFYYRDLHLFTLRQWISRVHSTYLSQTVICILLLLAMGITASSIGLNRSIEAAADGQAPFDITIQNQNADRLGSVDFDALLSAHGVEPDALAWRQDTPVYYNDPAVTGVEDASAAIRLSDCNRLLARQGAPAYPGPLPGLLAEGSAPLATGGLGLTCVVIPDGMAEELSLRRQVWSADYAGDPEETEKQLQAALAEYQETTAYLRVESRLTLYQEVMGNKLLALFLGLYLGLTFLLAAAAVLALQQLSQAADNAARYAVLRRLGAEEGMLSRSAVQQVALAFLLPLALALLHTVVGMKAANDLISMAAKVDTVHSALVTGGVLLAVYGGYFLATALACRRLALEGGESSRHR